MVLESYLSAGLSLDFYLHSPLTTLPVSMLSHDMEIRRAAVAIPMYASQFFQRIQVNDVIREAVHLVCAGSSCGQEGLAGSLHFELRPTSVGLWVGKSIGILVYMYKTAGAILRFIWDDILGS